MQINHIADRLRAALPSFLWNGLRKCANATLGPILFSLETGHLRSSLLSRAVDRHGSPLPWFTYPAIQFLMTKEFKTRRILEWGSGQSTLWWARRARQIVAFESNRQWFEHLSARIPSNATLHLVKEDLSDALRHLVSSDLFDVVVIDGLDRFRATELSLNHLAPEGIIIVDNAEGNQGPKPGYGIINLLRENRFSRIDFYGSVPGNTLQHCTAIFYRGDCFLTRGEENPRVSLSFEK